MQQSVSIAIKPIPNGGASISSQPHLSGVTSRRHVHLRVRIPDAATPRQRILFYSEFVLEKCCGMMPMREWVRFYLHENDNIESSFWTVFVLLFFVRCNKQSLASLLATGVLLADVFVHVKRDMFKLFNVYTAFKVILLGGLISNCYGMIKKVFLNYYYIQLNHLLGRYTYYNIDNVHR